MRNVRYDKENVGHARSERRYVYAGTRPLVPENCQRLEQAVGRGRWGGAGALAPGTEAIRLRWVICLALVLNFDFLSFINSWKFPFFSKIVAVLQQQSSRRLSSVRATPRAVATFEATEAAASVVSTTLASVKTIILTS